MKDILEKAEELGNLIRGSSVYRTYRQMSEELQRDPGAVKLINDFTRTTGEMDERRMRGDIIDQFESDAFEQLKELVTGSETIMKYLLARQEYLDLLLVIRKELGGVQEGFE